MKSIWILPIILICLTRIATGAEAIVITLEGVADRVRAQNPDLQAARLLIAEALGRARDAGRLSNPTFESDFEAGPGMAERSLEVGFAQAFPLTGRLRLQKDISVLEIKAAEAEVAHTQRQLVAAARGQVIDMLALRERRALLDEQAVLNEALVTSLKDAADKGEASLLEVGQARLEANRLALELAHLAVEQTTLAGELKSLLGMHAGEPLQVTGRLPEPAADGPEHPPQDRPDHQAALIRVQTAKREVELERARRIDDVELGVFASTMRKQDDPAGIESDRMLGVRLTIPLPLWTRNQGPIDEALARSQRRQLEADALAGALSHQDEATRIEMRQWRELIGQINDKLLPLASDQVALADQGYRSGQTEIQTLLQARQQQLELRVARLDALRAYHLARVRYPLAENSNSSNPHED